MATPIKHIKVGNVVHDIEAVRADSVDANNYIGAADEASNAATTNGNTYLKLYENNTKRSQFKIAGSGATKVTSDASGNITITSTDHNTNYYHTSGSWNGLTYTATAVGGAGELKFTVPTGTTGSTVALGNHAHSQYVQNNSIEFKELKITDGATTITYNVACAKAST